MSPASRGLVKKKNKLNIVFSPAASHSLWEKMIAMRCI